MATAKGPMIGKNGEELFLTGNFVPTSGQIPLREWIARAGITLKGSAYNTIRHEYLDQILDDRSSWQVFRKGAQVGISTTMLLKSFWISDCLGRKCVYYFQDDNAVSDFSNDRCQSMIDNSAYLASRVRTTNNVQLKQIGPGTLYFRGLFSKGKVKSIDADAIFLDELDEAKPSNVAFAIDRLMHSDLQWVTSLSQPSYPGVGIDAEFSDTDQHFWHVRCPSCGEWNCLDMAFPKNFIEVSESKKKSFPERTTHYRGCMRCEAKLNMAMGKWVPKHPGRQKRGYHLSQLFSQIKPPDYPNISTKIMHEYSEMRRSALKLERFTVSVLGWPYAGGNARITDEVLDWCEADFGFFHEGFDCFMGIDQGDTLTIVVGMISGDNFSVIHVEETEQWDRLDFLMNQFGVRFCVIDALPNKHSAKAFAARYPGRVAIQYFQGKEYKTGFELFENKINIQTVLVDRTTSIDSMVDRFESGRIALPSRRLLSGKALQSLEDFRRHLKNMVAKIEETPSGMLKKSYLSGRIENHFGMALNSAIVSAYELGMGNSGPMVMPVFGSTIMGRA
jgi:hypothetical protein